MRKRQQSGMPPRQLIPVFIDSNCISNIEEVLHYLGIEVFLSADGHHENLDHPVELVP